MDENDNKIYSILNKFKTKKKAYEYFNITPNSVGIRKLNEIAKSVNFDFDIYHERRKSEKKHCKLCNKELKKHQKKFCSTTCSAKYNNKNRTLSNETKNKISESLKKRKKIIIKKCKICGQEKCNNIEICKHTIKWFNNLVCFGFDLKKIGSLDICKEYYRVKELLLKEYFDNKLSPSDIAIKYNYNKTSENILHLLKSFKIKTRNLSESEINALLNNKLNGKIKNKKTKYQFKHGWHTTWNGKNIYYRSSYELKFAKKLDSKKIDYECEYFRIKYWDSLKLMYRVAIPDFYVKKDNILYEIKSKITFNKQNVIDKFNEYKKLGFTPILIYENTWITYDDIYKINENDFIL